MCQCYPLQVILRGRLLLSPSRHGVIRCVCEPLWLCVVVTACTFVRVRVQVAACICQREFSVRQDGDSLLCVVYESGDKNLTDPTDSTIWETTLFTKQLFPLTDLKSLNCLTAHRNLKKIHLKSKVHSSPQITEKPAVLLHKEANL